MNNEATVLVDSTKLAQVALAELSEQKVTDITDAKTDNRKNVMYIPKEFVINNTMGPKMVSASSDKTFDLYLSLLYMSQINPEKKMETKLEVDYAELSKYFGTSKEGKLSAYRHSVRKELNKLQQQYNLIKWTSEHGGNPIVELIEPAQPEELYKIRKLEDIPLPREYFEYGFNKTMSLTAKFMYLVGLYETQDSPTKPWWSMSQADIVKKYGVKRWTVYTGNTELKKANIIEIDYARTGKGKEGEFEVRPPSKYKVNRLLTGEERDATYETLKEEYGEDNFYEAKQMAADIDEPNDPLIIEALLDLIKIYDLEKVKNAVAVPAGYKQDNSMKHIRYIIGILQREKDKALK